MIHVCFVVDATFLGGAEHYVARVARGLDARRFRASVVLGDTTTDPALTEWAEALAAAGVPVVRAPMRVLQRPFHALHIVRTLEALAPDIVHVNMPGPDSGQNGLLVLLARLSGARALVTEHLPMVPLGWKRALLKRVGYGGLDLAITVSRANAGFLVLRQGVPEGRVRVVKNGLPSGLGAGIRSKDRHKAPAVLYIGNILPHKGLYRLIEALSELQTPWTLDVVGEGPDGARCRSRAAELDLLGRIRFQGRLGRQAVESALASADVLALPSEIEGMPYAILEAMAFSLPVIACDVFGVSEAVVHGETGLLVPPRDTHALASALEHLLSSPPVREGMGAAARRRFETSFTLERQLAEMEQLYQLLANGNPRVRGTGANA